MVCYESNEFVQFAYNNRSGIIHLIDDVAVGSFLLSDELIVYIIQWTT